MSDFHVQLTSNASTNEFPSNQPNHFKNRLPYPLQLNEPGWKVGMSSISLPEAPRKKNLKDRFLFRIQWLELVDPEYDFYGEELVHIREGDFEVPPKNGTELFNMVRNRYLSALNDRTISDLEFNKKNNPDELSYMVMNRAENGQCVIDNSRTSTSIQINNSPRYPKFSIGIELAKAMRWVKAAMVNGQPGYVLGPNLRKEFPENVVPEATDVVKVENNGEEMFFKVDPDVVNLSAFINWVFVDLDNAYERAFGNNRRSMHLYSNAGRSMIVGNQVTDLMREVPYALEERHFEPNTIQYLPVRSDGIDIIELQVSENDGKLVEFSPGVTSVTLHFKKV